MRRFSRLVWFIALFAVPCLNCGCSEVESSAGAADDVLAPSLAATSVALADGAPASELRLAQAEDSVPASEASPPVGGDPAAVTDSLIPSLNVKQTPAGEPPRTGEDWPRFLGPRDNGVSGEKGLLPVWPENGPPIIWEKDVGTGYSAPSVLGNQLVLHHRRRREEIVECFEADSGKPLWKYAYESNFSDPYGYNNGPRCSPLLTPERCYTFGAEGKLLCLNLATGEKIWERDTATDWRVPEAFFGVGSTPVLYGKLLITMVGGEPDAGVVAFDAGTGKTVWTAVSKELLEAPADNFQMDDKLASYSSLVVSRIHGHDLVLALMRDGLVALNPTTGEVHFSYFFRSRSFESVNAANPVVIDDSVLLSAAYFTGAALLKVKPDGKSFDEVWKTRNLQTHWSTTIHQDGFLYGFSGRHESEGRLRCLDLKTGDIVWETDGQPAVPPADFDEQAVQYFGRGSAILAEGKFIVLGERGMLALVDVNPQEFKELCRFKLKRMHYPCWTAPVLSRQRLYLRCEDYLVCLDLAAQPN